MIFAQKRDNASPGRHSRGCRALTRQRQTRREAGTQNQGPLVGRPVTERDSDELLTRGGAPRRRLSCPPTVAFCAFSLSVRRSSRPAGPCGRTSRQCSTLPEPGGGRLLVEDRLHRDRQPRHLIPPRPAPPQRGNERRRSLSQDLRRSLHVPGRLAADTVSGDCCPAAKVEPAQAPRTREVGHHLVTLTV